MDSRKSSTEISARRRRAAAPPEEPRAGRISNIQRIGWASGLISLGLGALWGGNVVALKIGMATFPPFWSAFWRMVTGLVIVGLWAFLRGHKLKPQRGEGRLLLVLGLLFTVQIGALNLGVNWTSPAYGVVLINTYPFFANLIGHFFVVEDRLSWRRLFGLVMAFGGICIVFLGRPGVEAASRPLLGNLIVTASGLLLGTRAVFTQRLVQDMHPVRPVFWQMMFSIPCFLLAGLLWESPILIPIDVDAVTAILYQGIVVAGVCFIVWTWLLTKHSPGSLSIFAFPTPIFGVLASAWFYDEPLSGRLWTGLAAVSAGIFFATRPPRGQRAESAPIFVRGMER